jgi:integral membrane protein
MKNSLKLFRVVGYTEGISFLLLLAIAMPLKYIFGYDEVVTIVGGLHGGLFILYVVIAAYLALKLRWSFLTFLTAGLASVLPFGPFIFDAKMMKKYAA